jgi:hypothetical protein
MRLRILLSFDHELFLGGGGSYADTLFAPTERLLRLADDLGVPITLFTDVLCAVRFREWDAKGFFEPYADQVRRAVAGGHDVQLHLHPHWLTTQYRDGRYLPSRDYRLADFRDAAPPNDIPGIVGRGARFLTELAAAGRPDYRCVAFRAGGYAVAPETGRIFAALYASGVRIDSSVAKGFVFDSAFSHVDFRGMPAKANWIIPVTGPLRAEAAQGLYEVPVAARPRTPINNIPFLVKRALGRWKGGPQGARGFEGLRETRAGPWRKLKRLLPFTAWMLTFDDPTRTVRDLMKILRCHVRAHGGAPEIDCATISHPKSMDDYSFGLLREFVESVRREYGSGAGFCTYRQLYDRLGLGAAAPGDRPAASAEG